MVSASPFGAPNGGCTPRAERPSAAPSNPAQRPRRPVASASLDSLPFDVPLSRRAAAGAPPLVTVNPPPRVRLPGEGLRSPRAADSTASGQDQPLLYASRVARAQTANGSRPPRGLGR